MKLWMSWSTGKDSAYALHLIKRNPDYDVVGLFTTVTRDFGRVAMHSTRESLLRRQAEALGLPLEVVYIPAQASNEVYEERMRGLIAHALERGVEAMAFGDLFLEDIRAYRERLLKPSGLHAVFPLWKKPTAELAQEMLRAKIKAVLTCVDPRQLSPAFAGREFDAQLLREFPERVDPCGENGEFHTFVYGSPDFRYEIKIQKGEIVERDGFVFADVVEGS